MGRALKVGQCVVFGGVENAPTRLESMSALTQLVRKITNDRDFTLEFQIELASFPPRVFRPRLSLRLLKGFLRLYTFPFRLLAHLHVNLMIFLRLNEVIGMGRIFFVYPPRKSTERRFQSDWVVCGN